MKKSKDPEKKKEIELNPPEKKMKERERNRLCGS